MTLIGFILLLPAAVRADDAAQAAIGNAPVSDVVTQQLKSETLLLDVEAKAAEQSIAPTLHSLHVYVGQDNGALLLRKVAVQIDDLTPELTEYSDLESATMQSGALQQLAIVPVAKGAHQLRATFYAYVIGAPGNTPPVIIRIDRRLSVKTQQGNTDLELKLSQKQFIHTPIVEFQQWRPVSMASDGDGTYVPGGTNDPQVRWSEYLAADGRYLEALSELLSIPFVSPDKPVPAAFSTRLAAYQAAYGLLPGGIAGPSAASSPAPNSNQTAVSPTPATIYARYDRGVSLLSNDATSAQGLAILDSVISDAPQSPVGLTLRDKTDLVLGYYLLRHQQGQAAIDRFDRVRSPGPYGNQALLGVGWAMLTSAVTEHDTRCARTPASQAKMARLDALRQLIHSCVTATDSEKADMLRPALAAWAELIGRNGMDPAVDEGIIAIPYGLDAIGAHREALKYYQRAIDLLVQTEGRYADAVKRIKGGGLIQAINEQDHVRNAGWHWWLADLANTSSEHYLYTLFKDDDFLAAVTGYQELRQMDATLAAHAQRLAALGTDRSAAVQSLLQQIDSCRSRIQLAEASQQRRLEAVALNDLQQHELQTEQYLVRARFAVARIYDPPPKKKAGKAAT